MSKTFIKYKCKCYRPTNKAAVKQPNGKGMEVGIADDQVTFITLFLNPKKTKSTLLEIMRDKKNTVFILYSRMVAMLPERNLHKFDHIKLLLGPKSLVTPIFVKAVSTRLSLTHFTHIFVFFQQTHPASRVFLSSRAVQQGGFFYKAEPNQEIFENSVVSTFSSECAKNTLLTLRVCGKKSKSCLK